MVKGPHVCAGTEWRDRSAIIRGRCGFSGGYVGPSAGGSANFVGAESRASRPLAASLDGGRKSSGGPVQNERRGQSLVDRRVRARLARAEAREAGVRPGRPAAPSVKTSNCVDLEHTATLGQFDRIIEGDTI